MCGRVIQSSGPLRYAIVDGMNVRDSRVHNYPRRWNAAPSQELLSPGGFAFFVTAFRNGLKETGYIEGRNVGGCPAFLLNIEKRSLPRLMLSGDGLASKDAV